MTYRNVLKMVVATALIGMLAACSDDEPAGPSGIDGGIDEAGSSGGTAGKGGSGGAAGSAGKDGNAGNGGSAGMDEEDAGPEPDATVPVECNDKDTEDNECFIHSEECTSPADGTAAGQPYFLNGCTDLVCVPFDNAALLPLPAASTIP